MRKLLYKITYKLRKLPYVYKNYVLKIIQN